MKNLTLQKALNEQGSETPEFQRYTDTTYIRIRFRKRRKAQ